MGKCIELFCDGSRMEQITHTFLELFSMQISRGLSSATLAAANLPLNHPMNVFPSFGSVEILTLFSQRFFWGYGT